MTDEKNKFGEPEIPNEEVDLEKGKFETEKTREVISVYYEAPPEDTEVIGVKFKNSGKSYYFDPIGVEYKEGCPVIVETARGLEYGLTVQKNHIVSGKEIVLPLRKVIRPATEEDRLHDVENEQKAAEALEICAQKVAKHDLDMKLISAEYTFDNTKLLFYFTSDGRVDFRDLLKDLAAVFKCRIELRQMGIRDEAKILGGLGTCGRAYCCHAFLPDFVQVSIKMAKEQNLSLNSTKISGACGRLMCCLRYEYDTYLEEGRRTPKVDSLVNTPEGMAVVIETKPLVGLVRVKLLNNDEAAPRVFHRDDLSPINKGDENYEKAMEEKSLEKAARAKGTTRAALKKATTATENSETDKKKEERPLRPAPKKAASYTGQVTPSALEPSKKLTVPEEKDLQKAENAESTAKKQEKRQNNHRKQNNRKPGRVSTKPQSEKSEQPKNEKTHRYEKITRSEQKNNINPPSGRQITPKSHKSAEEKIDRTSESVGENGEHTRKKRYFRPFHKKK